jgi:hypothetical protein
MAVWKPRVGTALFSGIVVQFGCFISGRGTVSFSSRDFECGRALLCTAFRRGFLSWIVVNSFVIALDS